MIVCLCNPTSDAQVSEACLLLKSEKLVIEKLKICQNCKRCSDEISMIFKQTLNFKG